MESHQRGSAVPSPQIWKTEEIRSRLEPRNVCLPVPSRRLVTARPSCDRLSPRSSVQLCNKAVGYLLKGRKTQISSKRRKCENIFICILHLVFLSVFIYKQFLPFFLSSPPPPPPPPPSRAAGWSGGSHVGLLCAND